MATHDLAHAALTWALMLALVVPGSFAPPCSCSWPACCWRR
jgi:hypothetical protein